MIQSPNYREVFVTQVTNALTYAIEQIETLSWLREEQRDHALNVLQLGFNHPRTWPPSRHLMMRLAPLMELAGWHEEWVPFLAHGRHLADQVGDLEAAGECYYWLGVMRQRLGSYTQAESDFRTSAELFHSFDDTERQGRGLMRAAFALVWQRRFGEACSLAKSTRPLVDALPLSRGYYHLVLSASAAAAQNEVDALYHAEQSLAAWRETGKPRYLGWGLNNLAHVHFRLGQYNVAAGLYRESLLFLERVNDPIAVAIVHESLGNIRLMNGDYSRALEHYGSAEATARKHQELTLMAGVANSTGMAYHGLSCWREAEAFYAESISLFEKLGNVPMAANTRDNLALTYVAQQRYAEAENVLRDAITSLESRPEDRGHQFNLSMLSETRVSTRVLRAAHAAVRRGNRESGLKMLNRRLTELRSIPFSNNFDFFLSEITRLMEFAGHVEEE